jgi:SAM-dependent methyltransferase
MDAQLNYGNWVRRRVLVTLAACTLGTALVAFLPIGPYRVVPVVLSVVLFVSFLFPFYAYVMFSQRGGRFQERVFNLILQKLGAVEQGRVLDIGSGNGVLAVRVAQQNRGAEVVGVDRWGTDWEYSKRVCEENASSAKVNDRVRFQNGDAAALDFPDATFDGAISNLTFHEVRSVADKRAVLQEAVRVVKPGGAFVFVDYFYEPRHYGESAAFEAFLNNQGLSQIERTPLHEMIRVPLLLRHPKILGKVGMIRGRK